MFDVFVFDLDRTLADNEFEIFASSEEYIASRMRDEPTSIGSLLRAIIANSCASIASDRYVLTGRQTMFKSHSYRWLRENGFHVLETNISCRPDDILLADVVPNKVSRFIELALDCSTKTASDLRFHMFDDDSAFLERLKHVAMPELIAKLTPRQVELHRYLACRNLLIAL